LVRRYQDPRPYQASVIYIAHDADLALLEVETEAFFEGMQPLDIGELPKVRSAVVTYGYPAGGEQISYTRGVVSRVELQSYVHIGNRALLAVQTDAAINPGNSGGPVIQEDKVAGVAFMGAAGLENTGYFIPPPVINHFLSDIDDGIYNGFPQAGIRMMPMQNPAYRRYMQLPDNDLGAKIDYIYQVPSSQKLLRTEDVVLQVGPYPVGSDGTIVYEGNRLNAGMAFNQVQNGQSIPLKLWREGKELSVDLPLYVITDDRAEGNQYVLPKYFVYAGLVFTPLSRDYLRTFGQNWADAAGAELVYELFYRRQESPEKWRPEPIVLSAILSHPVNANLAVRGRALIDKINGVRIEKLDDVIRAFESPSDKFDVIEFITQHSLECLDHAEAQQVNQEILKTYNVPKDRRL
jgi:S1-C subfamily serine protease